MTKDPNAPEWPRAAPEIIPPDRSRRDTQWRGSEFPEFSGTYRIYTTRLGLFGGALLVLALALLAAVLLLAFLGALLLWIPVLALVVIAAALFGLLRRRR